MFVMTKKEWDESIAEKLNHLCDEISRPSEAAQTDYIDTLAAYVYTIKDCERWVNLPAASVNNINTGFEFRENFGRRIGFIDTGVLFKKGKSGILFCENGLAIKPVMGKGEMFTDFYSLCTSAVVNNGKYLIAENKFTVTSVNGLPAIDATDTMRERLSEIRKVLILNSKEHGERFAQKLSEYAGKIAESSTKSEPCLNEAEYIYVFTYNTTEELHSFAAAIYALALTADAKFEKAAEIAKEAGGLGISEMVEEKKKDYSLVECGELYLAAKEKYEKSDYSGALKAARDSINKFAAVENWQLYFDALYASANESNKFNHSILESFKSHTVDRSDAKSEVINKEQERIAELTEKYENYLESIGDIILDKVLAEDLDFFRSNPEMCKNVDKYGMTAVMYAVLFLKYDIYSYLTQKYGACKQKNVFGHTILDIAYMKLDFDTALVDLMLNHNEELKAKCEAFEENQDILTDPEDSEYPQFAELDKRFRKIKTDGDPWKSDYAAFYFTQNASDEESYGCSKDAMGLFTELTLHYIMDKSKVEDDVLKHFARQHLAEGEKPDIPLLSECENTAEFQNIFTSHRKSSISGYIKLNLGEKGEFEKTADYEQRKQRISEEAERDFENNLERHKETCYSVYVSNLKKDFNNVEKTNLKIDLANVMFRAFLCADIKLGSYDADSEKFNLVYTEGGVESEIAIPIEIASDFKKLYENGNVKYRVDDFRISIDTYIEYRCSAYYKDKLYPFFIYILNN